jgi:hypothetical protein
MEKIQDGTGTGGRTPYIRYRFGLEVQRVTSNIQEMLGNSTHVLRNFSKILAFWQDMNCGTELCSTKGIALRNAYGCVADKEFCVPYAK